MDARMKIPGTDHPITVERSSSHIVVRAAGRVIVDTYSTLVLREADYPPVHYVPLADIDPSVLRPSSTTSYCPFKGEASYLDVVNAAAHVKDAIWTYEQPYDAVAAIAGHVAFYPDRVQITVDAA